MEQMNNKPFQALDLHQTHSAHASAELEHHKSQASGPFPSLLKSTIQRREEKSYKDMWKSMSREATLPARQT